MGSCTLARRVGLRGWLLVGALFACLLPLRANADGLRVGTSLAVLNYSVPNSDSTVNLFYSAVSARVARGRAGMTFSVPMMGISGGSVALSDEKIAVTGGDRRGRFGLGDMSVGLDYNLYQNRAKMIIVTLGGSLRMPSASTALSLGTGEYLLGLGLSGVYGITRKLMAFGDLRQAWVGIMSPVAGRAKTGEVGLMYWYTEKMGISTSLLAADYAGRAATSLELNVGLTYELFPGFMTNVGGIGGLFGGAPRGISFGFGFEI